MESSPSAAEVGDNDDLVMQFLVPLPARTLIRLKLVDKRWCSIISSPHFLRLHHLRHPKRQPLFLLQSKDSQFFIFHPVLRRRVPFHFGFLDVEVLQSCNGLLLLLTDRFRGLEYCVFNPSTMQSRNLNVAKPFIGLSLVFDPLISPHYKVFCVRESKRFTRVLNVYHSETHTWNYRVAFGIEMGKFIGGIYWKGGLYRIKSGCRYQRFSIEEGRTYPLPKPPTIRDPGRKKYFTYESNGHMHSLSLSLKPGNNWLDVYELSHGDYRWPRIYRVDLSQVLDTFAAANGTAINVIGMVREERLEDSILLFHVPGRIIVHRLLTQTFDMVLGFSDMCFHSGAYQFIETIASV